MEEQFCLECDNEYENEKSNFCSDNCFETILYERSN
jgi:hypothetical protein